MASVVARRTRQFPKDFGQLSTYVETVEAPEVIEPAERLLAAILALLASRKWSSKEILGMADARFSISIREFGAGTRSPSGPASISLIFFGYLLVVRRSLAFADERANVGCT